MTAIEADLKHPALSRTSASPELARFERRLPIILSVIAGLVDVISFLNLGLFTAHITGNLVVISAAVVRGNSPNLAQVLAIPVFVAGVGVVWLIAKQLERRGPALVRALLLIQFLLLIAVLVLSVIFNPEHNQHSFSRLIVAMIAVGAMACQFALLRVAVPDAPSTAVMTGNLTNAVLSLLDSLSSRQLSDGAGERLKKSVKGVVGFCLGCIVGAAAVSSLGEWAWSMPVVLAGVSVLLR